MSVAVLPSLRQAQSVVALVDCNNFFVSCERVFRPDLEGRPVVVLSNNDGCIVSRSNEAKAIGIKMGQPLFQARDLVTQHDVAVFSANFGLYGEFSNRVMQIITHFAKNGDLGREIYSIDEAFLDVSHLRDHEREAMCRQMRADILKWVKIPTSIGIAETKTLAKLTAELAKKC